VRSLRIEELRWPEIRAALESGFDTVVFGVGSTEQHGPHLPLASDTLMGEWMADAAARRLGKALVAPTIRVGCSQHHIAFPGTISIEHQTLQEILVSYVETLLNHGFRRAVIIPSHGGNFETVGKAVQRLQQAMPGKEISSFCDLNQLLAVSHQLSAEYGISPGASGAHAGEFETSILLFLRPDLVHMDAAAEGFTGDIGPLIPELLKQGLAKVTANGILGDGRLGDAARGEKYLEAWLDLVLKKVANDASVAAR
jgi:creatinine amidohydrolase/Fe(II)-dependent formamide hydrolase-like protein